MKKSLLIVFAVVLSLSMLSIGCGQQQPKAASSKEAIDVAKAMETSKEKVDYLMTQANGFYKSKEFQQAVDLAQYVLSYLDNESQPAKDLLEKAKQALTAKVDEAVGDVKKSIGGLGK